MLETTDNDSGGARNACIYNKYYSLFEPLNVFVYLFQSIASIRDKCVNNRDFKRDLFHI